MHQKRRSAIRLTIIAFLVELAASLLVKKQDLTNITTTNGTIIQHFIDDYIDLTNIQGKLSFKLLSGMKSQTPSTLIESKMTKPPQMKSPLGELLFSEKIDRNENLMIFEANNTVVSQRVDSFGRGLNESKNMNWISLANSELYSCQEANKDYLTIPPAQNTSSDPKKLPQKYYLVLCLQNNSTGTKGKLFTLDSNLRVIYSNDLSLWNQSMRIEGSRLRLVVLDPVEAKETNLPHRFVGIYQQSAQQTYASGTTMAMVMLKSSLNLKSGPSLEFYCNISQPLPSNILALYDLYPYKGGVAVSLRKSLSTTPTMNSIEYEMVVDSPALNESALFIYEIAFHETNNTFSITKNYHESDMTEGMMFLSSGGGFYYGHIDIMRQNLKCCFLGEQLYKYFNCYYSSLEGFPIQPGTLNTSDWKIQALSCSTTSFSASFSVQLSYKTLDSPFELNYAKMNNTRIDLSQGQLAAPQPESSEKQAFFSVGYTYFTVSNQTIDSYDFFRSFVVLNTSLMNNGSNAFEVSDQNSTITLTQNLTLYQDYDTPIQAVEIPGFGVYEHFDGYLNYSWNYIRANNLEMKLTSNETSIFSGQIFDKFGIPVGFYKKNQLTGNLTELNQSSFTILKIFSNYAFAVVSNKTIESEFIMMECLYSLNDTIPLKCVSIYSAPLNEQHPQGMGASGTTEVISPFFYATVDTLIIQSNTFNASQSIVSSRIYAYSLVSKKCTVYPITTAPVQITAFTDKTTLFFIASYGNNDEDSIVKIWSKTNGRGFRLEFVVSNEVVNLKKFCPNVLGYVEGLEEGIGILISTLCGENTLDPSNQLIKIISGSRLQLDYKIFIRPVKGVQRLVDYCADSKEILILGSSNLFSISYDNKFDSLYDLKLETLGITQEMIESSKVHCLKSVDSFVLSFSNGVNIGIRTGRQFEIDSRRIRFVTKIPGLDMSTSGATQIKGNILVYGFSKTMNKWFYYFYQRNGIIIDYHLNELKLAQQPGHETVKNVGVSLQLRSAFSKAQDPSKILKFTVRMTPIDAFVTISSKGMNNYSVDSVQYPLDSLIKAGGPIENITIVGCSTEGQASLTPLIELEESQMTKLGSIKSSGNIVISFNSTSIWVMIDGDLKWRKYGFPSELINPIDCDTFFSEDWLIGCYYGDLIALMVFDKSQGIISKGRYNLPRNNRVYDRLTLSKGYINLRFNNKQFLYALLHNALKNNFLFVSAPLQGSYSFDSNFTVLIDQKEIEYAELVFPETQSNSVNVSKYGYLVAQDSRTHSRFYYWVIDTQKQKIVVHQTLLKKFLEEGILVSRFTCLKKFNWTANSNRHCIFDSSGTLMFDLIFVPQDFSPNPKIIIQKYAKFYSYDSSAILGNGNYITQVTPELENPQQQAILVWKLLKAEEANSSMIADIDYKYNILASNFSWHESKAVIDKKNIHILNVGSIQDINRGELSSYQFNPQILLVRGGMNQSELESCSIVLNSESKCSLGFNKFLHIQKVKPQNTVHLRTLLVFGVVMLLIIMALLLINLSGKNREEKDDSGDLDVAFASIGANVKKSTRDVIKVAKWRALNGSDIDALRFNSGRSVKKSADDYHRELETVLQKEIKAQKLKQEKEIRRNQNQFGVLSFRGPLGMKQRTRGDTKKGDLSISVFTDHELGEDLHITEELEFSRIERQVSPGISSNSLFLNQG